MSRALREIVIVLFSALAISEGSEGKDCSSCYSKGWTTPFDTSSWVVVRACGDWGSDGYCVAETKTSVEETSTLTS